MGACNYGRSNYLIWTYEVDASDLVKDSDFIDDLKERNPDLTDDDLTEDYIWDKACDTANFWEEMMYEDTENLLAKHSYHYLDVDLEPGYYRGMQLTVEPDYPSTFDSEEDRESALEEIGNVAELLGDLLDSGWEGSDEDIADLVIQLTAEVNDIEVYDWDDPARDWEE